MSDYDLQIIVAFVVASTLFSGFLFLYAQDPNANFVEPEDIPPIALNQTEEEDETEGVGWLMWIFGFFIEESAESEEEETDYVTDPFALIRVFTKHEIWLVNIFFSAITIIGAIITLRFLRG
jgi:hypothetical protein